jgi:hypothetical protein
LCLRAWRDVAEEVKVFVAGLVPSGSRQARRRGGRLDGQVERQLAIAAAHRDEGKRDARFQAWPSAGSVMPEPLGGVPPRPA